MYGADGRDEGDEAGGWLRRHDMIRLSAGTEILRGHGGHGPAADAGELQAVRDELCEPGQQLRSANCVGDQLQQRPHRARPQLRAELGLVPDPDQQGVLQVAARPQKALKIPNTP